MKDSKIYTFDDFRKDSKKKEFVNKVKEAPSKVYRWCTEHPHAATLMATVTIPSVAKIAKVIDNNINRHHEFVMQELRYYDPSSRVRYNLKRKLKNWEKEQLAMRVANGEARIDILREFNVLKK